MNQRVKEYNQPIGEEVTKWEKREFPSDIRYVGNYTIITKLSRNHIKELYEVYENFNPSNWTYLTDECPKNYEEFEQMLIGKIEI